MSYGDYLRGKRVVFVGPSPILSGMRLGVEIESFDVVVKTGPAALIDSEDYFVDYGRRIDVLYMNGTFCRSISIPPVEKFKARGIKYIRSRIDNEAQLVTLRKSFDVDLIPYELVNAIFSDSLALMGTIAAVEILQYAPTEFHMTGVDFNTSRGTLDCINLPKAGDYKEYVPGYISGMVLESMESLRRQGIKDAHNHINDAQLIRKLIDEGRITVPHFVLDRLNLLLSYVSS